MVCAGKERWQVIWHAIRKLRWHRSIHARIDKGAAEVADASMAAMLIFSARSHGVPRLPRNPVYVRVLLSPPSPALSLPPPQKKKGRKIPRRSNWNLWESTWPERRVRVLTMYGRVPRLPLFFSLFFLSFSFSFSSSFFSICNDRWRTRAIFLNPRFKSLEYPRRGRSRRSRF